MARHILLTICLLWGSVYGIALASTSEEAALRIHYDLSSQVGDTWAIDRPKTDIPTILISVCEDSVTKTMKNEARSASRGTEHTLSHIDLKPDTSYTCTYFSEDEDGSRMKAANGPAFRTNKNPIEPTERATLEVLFADKLEEKAPNIERFGSTKSVNYGDGKPGLPPGFVPPFLRLSIASYPTKARLEIETSEMTTATLKHGTSHAKILNKKMYEDKTFSQSHVFEFENLMPSTIYAYDNLTITNQSGKTHTYSRFAVKTPAVGESAKIIESKPYFAKKPEVIFQPSIPPTPPQPLGSNQNLNQNLNGAGSSGNSVVCIPFITQARNKATGEIKQFPTSCDIPHGWEGLPFEYKAEAERDTEKKILQQPLPKKLGNLRGRILLQVESRGEGWYVLPKSGERILLGNPHDALAVMSRVGAGVSNNDLKRLFGSVPKSEKKLNTKNKAMARKLAGTIVLKVEGKGEAYYIDPIDLVGYYLGRPNDALFVMRERGLGIANDDLIVIPTAPSM